MSDEKSWEILIIILLIIFIALWEGCRYSIATDETMSDGEKFYWLQVFN